MKIENLHAGIDDEHILNGVSLSIDDDGVTALMGPNGSGKSTLAHVLMGNPEFTVYDGTVEFNGEDLLELEPDERSRHGLFMSFQYPSEVPGVTMSNFLRTALNARQDDPVDTGAFQERLKEELQRLDMDEEFAQRPLNEGFSGGEKKRAEILQMAMLDPDFAILDETDSGLDIDALQVVADGINRQVNGGTGVLLITHYQRILDYVTPDTVYVMKDGRVEASGGAELAEELEEHGYSWIDDE